MPIHGDYQSLAELAGEAPPRPLVFHASETENWDQDDWAAAKLAMERDMAMRQEYYDERNYAHEDGEW